RGSFENFERDLAVALGDGCAGFMVGRSLWGEAARATGAERDRVIADVARPRFERLTAMLATVP
ncbi:MAG: hypothetical protein ACR2O6_11895, partial [Ilumatobacteraceae bacterium]